MGCLIEYGELFELFPEGIVVLIVLCFFGRLRIVLNEPSEEFRVVNLLAEHFFAACSKKSFAFICGHSHEGFNGAIERIGAARLERTIVATDGAVFCEYRCMDAITEFVGIFQFA